MLSLSLKDKTREASKHTKQNNYAERYNLLPVYFDRIDNDYVE